MNFVLGECVLCVCFVWGVSFDLCLFCVLFLFALCVCYVCVLLSLSAVLDLCVCALYVICG